MTEKGRSEIVGWPTPGPPRISTDRHAHTWTHARTDTGVNPEGLGGCDFPRFWKGSP